MNQRLDQLLYMLEQDSDNAFILFALAKEYQQQNELTTAEKYFLQLVKLDPDYVGLYYHFAKNYEFKDELDQAKNTYLKGIEIAQKLKDHHAESELRNALTNMEMGL